MVLNDRAISFKTKYGYKTVSLVPDIKKIYLEVTTRCNFDCTTCIRNSWTDDIGQMDFTVFEMLLDQIRDLPEIEAIHIGGFGEPMSHPDILEMVRRIKEAGLKVEMITNGSFLTDSVIEKLIEMKLDMLFISLDGPEATLFNTIRKGADFINVIDHIKSLNRLKALHHSLKPQLGIEFVLMKSNRHKLEEMVNLITALKADQFIVTNVMPYHEDMMDEIVYDLETPLSSTKNSGLLSMRAKIPNMKLRTERYCNFIENKAATITWDGNVAPCYALMHRYKCFIYSREKQIIPQYYGNIKEMTLKDIWMRREYAMFRANVSDFNFPSCTDCEFLEGCTYTVDNQSDCWANSPSCADCLWSRRIIQCP